MEYLNKMEEGNKIEHLYNYHSYWIYPNGEKTRNPQFDRNSSLLLDLKKRDATSLNIFAGLLKGIIPKNSTVCIVPSHDPVSVESGIKDIANILLKSGLILDAFKCLRRHTKINKLATGGNRSIQIHKDSIDVINPEAIKGKDIFLLDDITTTGNSLIACKALLITAGAKSVRCYALGKTTH